MELRPGYKKTDVGIIPEEWDVRVLPEVCQFRSGKAHEQFISDLGQYVCVNSKFISTDGQIRKHSTANFCPAKINDVLMVMSDLPNGRALAKTYLVDKDDTYAVNQRVCSLTPYHDHAKYLFYVLNRNPYFLSFDNGVSQTHLLNAVFMKCPIALPRDVSEQHAIADALSDIDSLLAGMERLIAKKRDLRQAAMQQLLTGQTRLSGFSGEWNKTTLGECLSSPPRYGINAPASPYSDMLPTYIRITDITEDGRFSHENRASVRSNMAEHYLLGEGDIVFARTGASVGKSYLYNASDGPLVFAGFLIRVQPDQEKLVPTFLSAYVSTPTYWQWVRMMSMRSGQPGINGNEYQQLPISLPTLEEQSAISAVLTGMDSELVSLDQRLIKTRDLKHAMMQELLTGKTRLVAAEASHA